VRARALRLRGARLRVPGLAADAPLPPRRGAALLARRQAPVRRGAPYPRARHRAAPPARRGGGRRRARVRPRRRRRPRRARRPGDGGVREGARRGGGRAAVHVQDVGYGVQGPRVGEDGERAGGHGGAERVRCRRGGGRRGGHVPAGAAQDAPRPVQSDAPQCPHRQSLTVGHALLNQALSCKLQMELTAFTLKHFDDHGQSCTSIICV